MKKALYKPLRGWYRWTGKTILAGKTKKAYADYLSSGLDYVKPCNIHDDDKLLQLHRYLSLESDFRPFFAPPVGERRNGSRLPK